MKKKFIIFTLCFTLIFSSINYKRSYADGGVISLPILATVSSLAVASGIVIKNNDDLYDIGRMFYDYINKHNDLTWDLLTATFNSSVVALNNNLVSVDSKFLDICKSFFVDTFKSNNDIFIDNTLSNSDLSFFSSYNLGYNYRIDYVNSWSEKLYILVTSQNPVTFTESGNRLTGTGIGYYYTKAKGSSPSNKDNFSSGPLRLSNLSSVSVSSVASFPYNGSYDWDNVENKKDNDSIALPIPGNLGQLVGQGSTDFWDNTDNLVGNGDLSIPGVNNPSIDIDDSIITFPTLGDTPSDTPTDTPTDTPFANITDYIASLVVPSDMFWTDSFNSLHTNFTSSFPMVDMSAFNSLAVNGKPFPNIDIKIMGAKGRVVNGDTVNSIVDWLRPIVAGFVFLCLMFFNYRKLYKLIRNSEPFEGVGKVENHAN